MACIPLSVPCHLTRYHLSHHLIQCPQPRRLCRYSASYHKCPKTTRQQYFAHNFLCKKDKDTKVGTSFLHLFFLYFLKFPTKLLILSTLRVYALLGYFNFQFFATTLEYTYFLVKLELGIVKTEFSTRKSFQFYLFKVHIANYLKT